MKLRIVVDGSSDQAVASSQSDFKSPIQSTVKPAQQPALS
jgi:hypothetical protein